MKPRSEAVAGTRSLFFGCLVVSVFLGLAGARLVPAVSSSRPAAAQDQVVAKGPFSVDELETFTGLSPIDTHTHIYVVDPAFAAMLRRLNLHVLDICVAHSRAASKNLQQQIHEARDFVRSSPGRAALCTTFDPYPCERPGCAAGAIDGINRDFAEGAIAVKIWKNVGMEIKDARGHYIMPDDPMFEPIYRDIAAHHKTLVAHLAEPDSCWKAPDPASPDYSYYSEHPEWYMYGKAGVPSKAEILGARDHLVEENPTLRVVGAHLGSLESDFDDLGRHLDRYPNFAVDMAARMPYVMMLPRDRATAFITKYQDRLIYGTDLDYAAGADSKGTIAEWENYYARDWRFLATSDWVEYLGKKYQGLELPRPILEKLYHANAVHWFPGILGR